MGDLDIRYTSGDQYSTPPGTPPPPCPGICFYPWFMRLIVRYRSAVLQGEGNDGDYFSARSWEVIRRIERCGGRFAVTGLDHLRNLDGPAVFVSNHMSTLETVALPGIITPFRPVTFVVKRSLVKGLLFGPIMRSREPVVVSRKNPRQDLITVLREGRKILDRGISIVLFPQGTRSSGFNPRDFNSLGTKLARNSGVPLIPLALKTDFWSNGFPIRPLGRLHPERTIHIAFSPPIDPRAQGRDPHEQTLSFISGKLALWGGRRVYPS